MVLTISLRTYRIMVCVAKVALMVNHSIYGNYNMYAALFNNPKLIGIGYNIYEY